MPESDCNKEKDVRFLGDWGVFLQLSSGMEVVTFLPGPAPELNAGTSSDSSGQKWGL